MLILRKKIALLQLVIAGLCLTAGQTILSSFPAGAAQTLAIPDSLIAFNSTRGEALLLESGAKQDFWNLSAQFVTQTNQAYCGVASMVMILNSLDIPAPIAPQYEPYRVFTQDNFFNNKATRQVIAPEIVRKQGLTLEELGKLLKSYSAKATVYHAGDMSLEEFRKLAIANLNEPQNYIIINYLRRKIGQERDGHISPIAAYHKETDRFLILDVARYKYPPVWVKADDLWQSMNTLDTTSGKTRGFVLVNR